MSYKIDIVNPYERVYQEERSKSKIKGTGFLFNIGIQDVLLILIGFFLSRGTIMHSISPFGFPFMTYTLARRKKNWIALAIPVSYTHLIACRYQPSLVVKTEHGKQVPPSMKNVV